MTDKSALRGVKVDELQDNLLLSPLDCCGVMSFFVPDEDGAGLAFAAARVSWRL